MRRVICELSSISYSKVVKPMYMMLLQLNPLSRNEKYLAIVSVQHLDLGSALSVSIVSSLVQRKLSGFAMCLRSVPCLFLKYIKNR